MTTIGAPQHGIHRSVRAPRLRLLQHPWLIGIAAAFLILLITGAAILAHQWPFRYAKIKPTLEDTFGCQIAIGSYHRTYFPNPGFVASSLTLRRKSAPGQPPIATIGELYVQSHWTDFFTFRKRVHLFQMNHVHILLPPPGSPASHQDFPAGSSGDFDGPETPVQRFEVRDMKIEVLRSGGGSYIFPIGDLHIEDMQAGHEWTYAVAMRNAIPSGDIVASGRFGPLNKNNPGATPISGQFRFTHVNLHDLGKVSGILSAFGTFHGPLQALQTDATTAARDFAIADGHPSPIAGALRCIVNGTNGDVAFEDMELRTGETLIRASGQVNGSPHETNLDVAVANGRAQDLLRPFVHRAVPITGPVFLHAHAYLAPTRAGDFFHRLKVDGAFEIPAERITNKETEKNLTAFSQRAQGKNDAEAEKISADTDAVASIAGPVQIRDAVAISPKLTFVIPGADANLHGTFNFHTSAAHFTGDLRMQADISHAATGFKSFLLKPLAPFFKKKKAGAVVPIAVTGTKGHYQVQQNIAHAK